MEIVLKYFPNLNDEQKFKFNQLQEIYSFWNSKLNLISRKDIDSLYEKHVLHALSIANFITFNQHDTVVDVGTGGGFPGIPLAIYFPNTAFTLIDSIGKKTKAVEEIVTTLNLKNVTVLNIRSEQLQQKFGFVISRAVANFPEFIRLTHHLVKQEETNKISNGIISLKGGDVQLEMDKYYNNSTIINLQNYFNETFFETKKLIHLPRNCFL